MHSFNPRPIVSILILFTKLFSCFLCVLVIFSIGTRVAVLWFYFLRSPCSIGLHVLFPSDWPCMLLAVIVRPRFLLSSHFTEHLPLVSDHPLPHSITMRTPVLTTSSIHPPPSSPTTSSASGKTDVPRSFARVQCPITPYTSFLNSRQPVFFVSPTGPPLSIDILCHLFQM